MKKILILLLLFSASKTFAQNFEGTIKWTFKIDITDPKKKAEMEQAQKKMNDPATQAQMKELETKMNDPQFKAMMESNPQMKAQMDKLIAAAKTGNMNSMFPTGLNIKMKNGDVLSKMEGGMFATEMLYLKSKDQSYTIDRENKTYSILSKSDKPQQQSTTTTTKVTKTAETAKVLNYTCTKYLAETTSNGKTIVQTIWATTEIKDVDFSAMAKQRIGRGQQLSYDEIQGVPMKVEMSQEGVNMTMEVTDIKKESLASTDFSLPAGFKEVPPMFK